MCKGRTCRSKISWCSGCLEAPTSASALATLVATETTLGHGLGRLASGLAFSLGLIMLVVAGGELFTGNNLMVLAFARRKVSSQAVLRNWGIAYLTNAAGAVMLAGATHLSGIADNAALKATAIRIAEAKVQLGSRAASKAKRLLLPYP